MAFVDIGALENFILGGKEVKDLIRKTPVSDRGIVASGFKILPTHNSYVKFLLAKASYQSRTQQGTIYKEPIVKEDMELFIEDVEDKFPSLVKNKTNVESMNKSYSRTLVGSYLYAKLVVQNISSDRRSKRPSSEGQSQSKRVRVSLKPPTPTAVSDLPDPVCDPQPSPAVAELPSVMDFPQQERVEKSPSEAKLKEMAEGFAFFREMREAKNARLKTELRAKLDEAIRKVGAQGRIDLSSRKVPIEQLPLFSEIINDYVSYGFRKSNNGDVTILMW